MSTNPPETTASVGTGLMRASAAWFLAQTTPPRHGLVQLFSRDFKDFLHELIPHVEKAAGRRPPDDGRRTTAAGRRARERGAGRGR